MQIGFHLNAAALMYELGGKWTLDHCSVCLYNRGRKSWCFLAMGKINKTVTICGVSVSRCGGRYWWVPLCASPCCLQLWASCLRHAFVTVAMPWGQKVPVGGLRAWVSPNAVLIRTREGRRKGPSVLSLSALPEGWPPGSAPQEHRQLGHTMLANWP